MGKRFPNPPKKTSKRNICAAVTELNFQRWILVIYFLFWYNTENRPTIHGFRCKQTLKAASFRHPGVSFGGSRVVLRPYCLPWWFRATASLHKPAALVAVHAGPAKALEAQMVVKVPTVSYASLMQRYNVTSLHLLKIDTEGFDVFILRQMLNWGKISSQYPERVQFERNNLTDMRESDDLFLALQAVYDCWAPITEDDVQCLRLRDVAASGLDLPLAFSGRTHGMSVWWRMELPDRLTVAFVQWKMIQTPMHQDSFEVTVGDSPDVHQNHRCKVQNRRNDGKDEGMVAVCGLEGRYVAFVGSASLEVLQNMKVLVPQSDQGAFRLSTGRVCCHRGCHKDTKLFEGYDPRCEERCRSDIVCRFFTSFSSLWCITYADCDEELLSLAATGWWFHFFYFHPYLGKIPILTNIFQMG